MPSAIDNVLPRAQSVATARGEMLLFTRFVPASGEAYMVTQSSSTNFPILLLPADPSAPAILVNARSSPRAAEREMEARATNTPIPDDDPGNSVPGGPETAANAAANSAVSAANSALAAHADAALATTKAAAAAASASSAAASADSIDNQLDDAAASATAAAASASLAAQRAAEATTTAGDSATSAAAAATSAATAIAKASEATTSVTSAAGSASTASTRAGEAAASATAASNSAGTASTKATEAASSATAAAGSAATAGTKAVDAATSATAAAGSATTATTKANAAAASATSAANSASNAGTSAGESANWATASEASANSAATRAGNAATSATAAAGSATLAGQKATDATTKANDAAASATAAAGSAATASTKATDAATSAAASQTRWDEFRSQYLGALSGPPTTNPLGGALQTGNLYFDTTLSALRIRTTANGWADYLPMDSSVVARLSGAAFTGPVKTSSAPTAADHLTRKDYVDTGLAGKQANLGFTPVRQGGGTGQGDNIVRLGWSTDSSGLRAQVDFTDLGVLATRGWAQNEGNSILARKVQLWESGGPGYIDFGYTESSLKYSLSGSSSEFLLHSAHLRWMSMLDWGGTWALAINSNDGQNAIYFPTAWSDSAFKENVSPTSVDALSALRALEMVQYDWNDDGLYVGNIRRELKHVPLGVIGQQAIEHASEMFEAGPTTLTDGSTAYRITFHPERAVPRLIRALQQMADKADSVEDVLLARIAALEARIEALEA
ncbi:tail fiber domain-containing protein [Roseococcus pinisoli]|uniref:Tail fiber domain-containing protein n=1 Tax=Roseococcus pinisoli TaxID=2835040 RepID=A0ABS5QF64_9PROT|nr:tail fiber domain-containing protein [Roseococcus pinisoli]MBS7812337.1 tail fiber domain-containing protein [Roseococcus pinisoli]